MNPSIPNIADPPLNSASQSVHRLVKTAANVTFFASSLAIVLFSLLQRSLVVLLAYVVFATAGSAIARAHRAERLYLLIFATAVLATIAIFYTYVARYGLPYVIGGSDDLQFEADAAQVASQRFFAYDRFAIRDAIRHPFHNSPGYVYLVSLLIRFGEALDGYHTVLPRLLNCFVLGLCGTFMFSTGQRLGLSVRQATIVGSVTGLFPMMLFVAAHAFRDVIIAFIIILSVYNATIIATAKKNTSAALATLVIALCTVVVFEFRYLYVLATVTVLGCAWYIRVGRRMSARLLVGLVILGLVGLTIGARQLVTQSSIFSDVFRYQLAYQEHRQGLSEGLSQNLFALPFPWNVAGRVVYASISPLPVIYAAWEWNLLALGTIWQFFFAPFIVLGGIAASRARRFWPALLGFMVISSSYVFGSFTYRHLASVIPLAALFGVMGYDRYRPFRQPIWLVCFSALVVGALGYVILKKFL